MFKISQPAKCEIAPLMQNMVHKVMKIVYTDFPNFFFVCFCFKYRFNLYFNKDRVIIKISPQTVRCN